MRYTVLSLILISFSFIACGPDEVVKKYICPIEKPYLNDVDKKCYSSKEAADAANEANKEDPPVTPEPEPTPDPEPQADPQPVPPET
ncbi:MAG: hypothetical protein WC966_06125 [Bradymonadales bacterium]